MIPKHQEGWDRSGGFLPPVPALTSVQAQMLSPHRNHFPFLPVADSPDSRTNGSRPKSWRGCTCLHAFYPCSCVCLD